MSLLSCWSKVSLSLEKLSSHSMPQEEGGGDVSFYLIRQVAQPHEALNNGRNIV